MKISIIVPVYNVGEYFPDCVASLVGQSHSDIEILLIDDGSTDNSGQLCDQYQEKYPSKVRCTHTKNQGQVAARSHGMDIATGDVLLFVDADDCLRSDAAALLSARFESTGCDMVLFNASLDKDYSTAFPGFPFFDGQHFSGEGKKALYEICISSSKLNPLWIKAVRRDIAVGIDARFRQYYMKNAGDLLYTLPMLTAAQNIIYLDENLYLYRSRPGSIVHSYNPLRHRSIRTVHREMERYIDLWGMQHMHGLHYAREVRGWVDCLLMVLGNETRPDMKIIRELAEDEYFRSAYDRMDRHALSRRDALLAGLLHRKHYLLLRLAGRGLRAVRAAKNLLKGKRTS